MTTHDQHTYAQPTEGIEDPREGTDPVVDQVSDPTTNADTGHAEVTAQAQATQPDATTPQPDAAMVSAEPTSNEPVHEPTESDTEQALFADDELVGLRARWDDVQAGFVDDPRECVHKADGLVSDVVDQLTVGFSSARTRLEEQWARGEDASTEDLRVALKRYREFFQRLLAV